MPAGRIRYREAGEGKPVVFVHGFLVDGRLWDGVVDRLSDRCRCIAPDWPIGAQQIAMKPDADLSPPGIAAIIDSFLAALELEDVTIVGNDSGGAMSQVLVTRHPERIGRLVLTNCDTHENFPPGIFKAMPPLAKLPGGMTVLSAPFRIGALARAAFKPFAKTKIPDDLVASWMAPEPHDPGVKRDAKKVTAGMNKRYTLEAAEKLSELRPADAAHLGAGRQLLPDQVRGTAGEGDAERAHRPDPRREHLRGARPARSDSPTRSRRSSSETEAKRASCAFFFATCMFFVRSRGEASSTPPTGRRAMAQGDLRPGPAQEHDGAAPRRGLRRLRAVDPRAAVSAAQRGSSSARDSRAPSRISGSAAAVRTQEPRAL